MLLKENLISEGLRLLVTDFEPYFVSLKMVLQQGFVNFSFGASEDPRKRIDRLETQIRQNQSNRKK